MEESVFGEIDTVLRFKKLKKEVEENFISINTVCKEAKVSASVVSGWNTGKHRPTSYTLNKLIAAFKRIIEKRDNRKSDV